MTTTLTARDPGDLLAAVPVVLGFHPSDSLVMLTFDGHHSPHARVDLPPPDEVTAALPELADALLAACLAHRVGRVALVCYTDDPLLSARVAEALRPAFHRAGIGVIDVLRAHDRRWWQVPPPPGRAAVTGTPYDERVHPFAAQAVFDGRVTHASRDALRATLEAVPDAVARVAALQAEPPARQPAGAGWAGRLVARCVATATRPDDAEAARLLAAVVGVEVRDAALRAAGEGRVEGHLAVWSDLLRRAPDASVPDTAALVAFCAWQCGHGALAWCALDRCFEVDPEHRLGRCLAECLTRAVPPSAWAESAGADGPAEVPT